MTLDADYYKVHATGSVTIIAPPTLASIAPNTVVAGGTVPVTLSVTGANYVAGSQVMFNGTPLTTGYGNSTSLTATVPASMLTSAGTASITVINPAPHSATSGAKTLSIVGGLPKLVLIVVGVSTSTYLGTVYREVLFGIGNNGGTGATNLYMTAFKLLGAGGASEGGYSGPNYIPPGGGSPFVDAANFPIGVSSGTHVFQVQGFCDNGAGGTTNFVLNAQVTIP